MDVSVVRSAECWTDHKLLKAKLQFQIPPTSPPKKTRARYAVSRLRDAEIRAQFSKAVIDEVNREWSADVGGEGKWKQLHGEWYEEVSRNGARMGEASPAGLH